MVVPTRISRLSAPESEADTLVTITYIYNYIFNYLLFFADPPWSSSRVHGHEINVTTPSFK